MHAFQFTLNPSLQVRAALACCLSASYLYARILPFYYIAHGPSNSSMSTILQRITSKDGANKWESLSSGTRVSRQSWLLLISLYNVCFSFFLFVHHTDVFNLKYSLSDHSNSVSSGFCFRLVSELQVYVFLIWWSSRHTSWTTVRERLSGSQSSQVPESRQSLIRYVSYYLIA